MKALRSWLLLFTLIGIAPWAYFYVTTLGPVVHHALGIDRWQRVSAWIYLIPILAPPVFMFWWLYGDDLYEKAPGADAETDTDADTAEYDEGGRPWLKLLAGLTAIVLVSIWVSRLVNSKPTFDPTVCAGPPLADIRARNDAYEAGYAIHPQIGCITRSSFDAVKAENAKQRAPTTAARPSAPGPQAVAPPPTNTLADARRAFQTRIQVPSAHPTPIPTPPANLFVPLDDRGGLKAFISPDPRDGAKHAAIIWLTGGDTNSLDDFWTPGRPDNDQSAHAFRDAGVIMVFPTLRGGNQNPGGREYFYGEVDDVLATADALARVPYVDPQQIYLGGHSTGGTLALLTAEVSGRFQGVFAFGPVAEVQNYPRSLVPVNFDQTDPREQRLRSPVWWLDSITSPTWLIEGAVLPSNVDDLDRLCRAPANPKVHCIRAAGLTHFSVLAPATRIIAARLAVAGSGITFHLNADDFVGKPAQPAR